MNNQEKLAMLEDIMELEAGDLTLETVLEDVEEWDSLSKLSLMAAVKKNFSKSLSVATIKGFVTVADICNFLDEDK